MSTQISNILRIGEYSTLGTMPFYHALKHMLPDPKWRFVPGSPESLGQALERGEVDIALASPLILANAPRDFMVFADLGYAGRGHMRDMLLFSDLYLDDMDEMTVALPQESPMVGSLMHIILERYLHYQNQYISGWGNAEAFVLDGDSALRERMLARYAYVYDVGDLWRHYTGHGLAYYLWMARTETVERNGRLVAAFHRRLNDALAYARQDWDRLSLFTKGYDWIRKSMIKKLWEQVDYELKPEHFDGLNRFFEDSMEVGTIEEVPELQFYEAGVISA
jgi:chorismate dehydratase